MNLRAIFIFLLTCGSLKAQECSPFWETRNYILDDAKSAGIGYVACLHARGVVAEVGYNNVFVGILAMGQGHSNATYGFVQYDVQFGRARFYAGPAYRLNNEPIICIGRAGLDFQVYRWFYTSLSLIQVDKNVNYLHYGIKINY